MHRTLSIAVSALILGAVGVVLGQDRDRRSSGYEPRDIIRRLDDNNNGIIEPNEVSDRSRSYLAEAAKRAGLDMNQPMAADRLLAALEQSRDAPRGDSNSSSSSGRSSGSSGSSIKPPAGLNGFGPPAGGALPGFGAPGVASNASLEAKYDRRILDYVEGMLRDQDKNRDGFIDSIEWQSGRWRDPPESSDTNKDSRLSKEELCVRIAARYGDSSSGSSSGSGSGSSGSSSSGSGSSGSSSGDTSKFRSYAESLLRQYDKNKNGYLEKDEWSEMKSEHRGADTNADAVITLDELTNRLQAYSGGGSSSSSSGSSSSGSSSSPTSSSSSSGSKSSYGSRGYGATPTNPSDRKSYRVSTATERLPKGLPDWFLRGDADADGQLRMVEYAASWNEETAAQFFKYDLNGDGIITPDECLIVDKKK